MKYRGVVFDLDGTLVDSLNGIAHAMNQVLLKNGCASLPTEEYVHYIGKGVRELIIQARGSLMDMDEVEQYEKDLACFYSQCFLQKTTVFSGIEKVLSFLQSQGIRLGVLSNKPHYYTQSLVEYLFKDVSFDYIKGIDEEHLKKPHRHFMKECLVKMGTHFKETLFVGDSLIDARTAQKMKMDFYFVHWGYCSRKEELSNIFRTPFYEGQEVDDLYQFFKKNC